MAEVKIEIVNCQMEDLGVEQSPTYVPLRFKDSAFVGYWIGTESDSSIKFYLGSNEFLCRKTAKNIELFESLIK